MSNGPKSVSIIINISLVLENDLKQKRPDLKFADLDKKGNPELIIKVGISEYGAGGEMDELFMIILVINDIP